jgi:peptidyl-prolyl cis-trans isomerase SurA
MRIFVCIVFAFIQHITFSQVDTTVLSAEEKMAYKRLEGYRQQVLKGEKSMTAIATLYSEDPGSAKTGGRYTGIARGMFVSEFENVVFNLKPGEISEVFKTMYGFHFVKLLALHDGLADLQHVLVTTKTNPE